MRRGLILLAALTLSACAQLPVSRTYLGAPEKGVTLLAPAGWETFDAGEVAPGATPAYLVGFGEDVADPRTPMDGSTPGGVLSITLHPGLQVAKDQARNAFILDLQAALDAGNARILQEYAPVVDGLHERRRWTLEVKLPSGTLVKVLQEVATGTRPVSRDASGTELYPNKTVILGCTPECFDARVDEIRSVADSMEVS